jgi:hypothetical protein
LSPHDQHRPHRVYVIVGELLVSGDELGVFHE